MIQRHKAGFIYNRVMGKVTCTHAMLTKLTGTQFSIPYKSSVTLTGEAPVIVGTGCILITRITQTLVNVLTCMSITSVARGAGTLIAAWSVQTLCILITCPRSRTLIDI